MKVLISWLREFVDVTASPEDLGRTLSMRGFELAAIEKMAIDTGRSPKTDAVIDFEITANRPDCLSVLGLAREAATAYSLDLRQPGVDPITLKRLEKGPVDVSVTLEAADLCPRYSATVVDVTIEPSPAWLANRLHAVGVRPINNVVDVTNYVLVELGQPMHAFDLEKLGGRALRIRRAAKGEQMKTLDGVERMLDPEMLVIADANNAQAIAGVMGGGRSEVSASTKIIVLESACFEPKAARLASKRLGLKTEASARFERGTDIDAPVLGLERACALLEAIGAGKARGSFIDEYPRPKERKRLTLRRARIERVLGQAIPDEDVERFLSGLGFGVSRRRTRLITLDDDAPPDTPGVEDADWDVVVPTFRVDVSREVDLIEEIGRHYGYDRLPATFPALETPSPPSDPRIERDRTIRRLLLAAGCSEAITFSFIGRDAAAPFADESDIVPISNPLTTQFSVLRPSLLPGLLASLAHNRNRQLPDVRLFEVGACVTRKGEERRVAVAWAGEASASHWSSSRRDVDFFDVKGLVERLAEASEIPVTFDDASIPGYLVRGRAANVLSGGQSVGAVGLLTQDQDVYIAELNLDALDAMRTKAPLKFTPLPRYPSIARDISIVVDEILPAVTVRGTIGSAAPETLASVHEFDRYQGKGVPDGRVSLSLHLTFRSPERTLTDAEVDAAMTEILAALKKAHDAVQR